MTPESATPKKPRILPSHRGHLYFVEHTRLSVEDGCTVFQYAENGRFVSYNLPYANTSIVMLGEGTSVTRDAVRMCAEQGVLLVFTGGGGSPFLAGTSETCIPLDPGGEYRPTEYMQAMARIFFDENHRLRMARALLQRRYRNIEVFWAKLPEASDLDLAADWLEFKDGKNGQRAMRRLADATSTIELLSAEAELSKNLYRLVAKANGLSGFVRDPHTDVANRFLDQGNYLMYGIAAFALYNLGISYAFPVLHGKTRRGGLVFDVADLIKDGVALPLAFYGAQRSLDTHDFRQSVIEVIHGQELIGLLMTQFKALLEC